VTLEKQAYKPVYVPCTVLPAVLPVVLHISMHDGIAMSTGARGVACAWGLLSRTHAEVPSCG